MSEREKDKLDQLLEISNVCQDWAHISICNHKREKLLSLSRGSADTAPGEAPGY